MSVRPVVIAAILSLSSIAPAHAAYEACGQLQNPYGPFDYRTQHARLEIVERYHFTPGVEALQGGSTSSMGGDIDYTLRASPNHPRALMAMANLALRDKTRHVRGAHYTVDCYFDRAIRFAPNDGTVYMIYGTYLFRAGEKAKALTMLEQAEATAEDSANLHYNLGLVYLDAGQYDKALAHAQKAYALGFQLPGLKNKLVAAGKWQDAAAPPAPATPPASPPPAAVPK
jgi:Tfp pilus assembly protein PilF